MEEESRIWASRLVLHCLRTSWREIWMMGLRSYVGYRHGQYCHFITKEQLGYSVDSSPRMTYRMLAYCFRVMSSKYSPVYLQSRIDNFINGLSALLDGLDEETFEHHRSGLIADKLEKDPSLNYQTSDYWSQIVDKRYMFDMSKLEAEQLRTVRKDDVIAWYNTYIRSSSPKRRRLAVHLYGCNSDIAEAAKLQEQSWTIIDDVKSLKVSSQFYSSLC